MTGARIRLIVAALAFAGWMAWLAAAVLDKGHVDPVSRAQLTEATILVVAKIEPNADGKPNSPVKVVRKIGSTGPAEGSEIEIENLLKAEIPGKGFPGDGEYLLPLVSREGIIFSIAGLPRSPGYEAVSNPLHPAIYPWNDATQIQLKKLGYNW